MKTFDDEELVLDENTLERSMKTRVGGKEKDNSNEVRGYSWKR